MLKPIIKDADGLINAKDIYNLFNNPFTFKRKMRDYQKSINSDSDLISLDAFCAFLIDSLERMTPEEGKNNSEDTYLLTEEAAIRLLEKEFGKYLGKDMTKGDKQ